MRKFKFFNILSSIALLISFDDAYKYIWHFFICKGKAKNNC